MNYEQKYKEALERARKCLDEKRDTCFVRPDVIFPELAESEDERMIRRIIEALQRYMPTDELLEEQEMVAWLEKQGNKPKWSEEDSLMIDSIIDTMKWLEGKGATNMKIDWLEQIKQRMEEQQ